MYEEPSSVNNCGKCKHKEYDSFFDERWCGHKPVPEGVGHRYIIDNWGTCEYFETRS